MDRLEILQRLRTSDKVFKVWDGDVGPTIMFQPWGEPQFLTWRQAAKIVGEADIPRKPVQSALPGHGIIKRRVK